MNFRDFIEIRANKAESDISCGSRNTESLDRAPQPATD